MERVALEDLQKFYDVLERLLGIDDEPCWYDHHGYCQAHFLEDYGKCTIANARELLEEYKDVCSC